MFNLRIEHKDILVKYYSDKCGRRIKHNSINTFNLKCERFTVGVSVDLESDIINIFSVRNIFQ